MWIIVKTVILCVYLESMIWCSEIKTLNINNLIMIKINNNIIYTLGNQNLCLAFVIRCIVNSNYKINMRNVSFVIVHVIKYKKINFIIIPILILFKKRRMNKFQMWMYFDFELGFIEVLDLSLGQYKFSQAYHYLIIYCAIIF